MKQIEADRLAQNLVTKFGLPITAKIVSNQDRQHLLLVPIGAHPNESFQVRVQIGWRSLFFDLLLGTFAADLVQYMGQSSFEKKQIFANVAQTIIEEKAVLALKINGSVYDPLRPELWPKEWRSINFSLRKTPLEINTDDHGLTEQLLNLWVERVFGCIIALSPLEEILDSDDLIGLPEGASSKVTVNRYERNRFNRTLCINFHGTNCKVCEINFESIYGPIGDGFIHVHHVVPVSSLGEDYIINPVKDLIPVCPNCHAMLHKRSPPYTITELKEIILRPTSRNF